jgi:hypothetical protein
MKNRVHESGKSGGCIARLALSLQGGQKKKVNKQKGHLGHLVIKTQVPKVFIGKDMQTKKVKHWVF